MIVKEYFALIFVNVHFRSVTFKNFPEIFLKIYKQVHVKNFKILTLRIDYRNWTPNTSSNVDLHRSALNIFTRIT